MRYGRGAATEAERELKRVAQDATEPAPESDVDDEVRGRVDDEQQLADYVESHQMLLLRILETVLEVTLRKRHLHTNTVSATTHEGLLLTVLKDVRHWKKAFRCQTT